MDQSGEHAHLTIDHSDADKVDAEIEKDDDGYFIIRPHHSQWAGWMEYIRKHYGDRAIGKYLGEREIRCKRLTPGSEKPAQGDTDMQKSAVRRAS